MTEVKSIQELEEILNDLEPDKQVKIVYKLQGREIVLEGSAKKSE